jgi:uncharacterized membrane-anchored protein YhcB (DUF1043 family)
VQGLPEVVKMVEEWDNSWRDWSPMNYILLLIALIFVLVVGVPLMERLLRWIRPLTPKQEEAHRFLEEARRSLDKFRRY